MESPVGGKMSQIVFWVFVLSGCWTDHGLGVTDPRTTNARREKVSSNPTYPDMQRAY